MSLMIELNPEEEARFQALAEQEGLLPAEWIRRVALGRLSPATLSAQEILDSQLRRWQAQDGAMLSPDIPIETLFAQWAEEDAQMTDEEREAEDRLWEDLEKCLIENRGLQLRRLGE